MTSLWPRIEPILAQVERPARYINHEWGCTRKAAADVDFRFCMMYPDTYELGQANQAVRILVNAVNAVQGMAAERGFLPAPDMIDLMREQGIPLFSVEGCEPVRGFDAVGVTLPHELCATNVVEMLDLAGIPVRAAERGEGDPIVVGGGPCAFNPEPFALFFDAINIGEGEQQLPELLEALRACRREGATRAETLVRMAQVPGVYVPALYEPAAEGQGPCAVRPVQPGVPAVVTKRVFAGFAQSPAWEPCVVPYTEVVHDRLNVEILRGCARGCRFCQAGMMYRPVRERSADNVVLGAVAGLAATGYDEVSLTSLSSTDHSRIAEILTRLNASFAGSGVRISLPSQRLDSFGVEMAHLVAGQKKGGLTFAPEAGTQRLRDVINKNVTEDDLFAAVDAAFQAGWRRCKLYFMIGLPTETDEDILGIASLAQRVLERARQACPPAQRGAIKVGVSVAQFVPKSHTPFQFCGQIPAQEAQRRVDLLRHSVKSRAIDISWHHTPASFVEAVMARGGREAGEWVLAAWRRGARFDAWTELFCEEAWQQAGAELLERTGWSAEAAAARGFAPGDVLPWAHISAGVTQAFLAREYERALQGATTPDCTFGACSNCGACAALGAHNDLAGKRVGKAAPAEEPALEGGE